ncbi:peroxiredoxin [Mycobacterium sp. CBMA 234]|uniref:MerR family transcriptional regulator n=1 Tax=Mycolicibacterium sp. CBMA 234 TaxID=1918495 RepID=UPI0012DDF723|nr:MerR family transcriptional regulator [Mycolicibacterium sp. CBMA 234]MUL63584.1 peroxiredoxin [Mycolicibacterium sp. CBMA 234]
MRISELAAQAGVSAKAVRYYEQLGLIVPQRGGNGYREYTDAHLRAVTEIRELAALGVPPSKAAPFIECLDAGHPQGDDCPASMAVYRDSIADIDRIVTALTSRRAVLMGRLIRDDACAANSDRTEIITMPTNFTQLPAGLPQPVDDGRAAHLPGLPMPDLALRTSAGDTVNLAELPTGRTVIYLYPLTGRPGVDLPDGWDNIPGARGCSTEACNFRDHYGELQRRGVAALYGMSSQEPDYQAEVVDRLHLPFPMLSDPGYALADTLNLPTFEAMGHPRLYSRLTLVVTDGIIEHVFYPIFPPNTHAEQVQTWLDQHPQ